MARLLLLVLLTLSNAAISSDPVLELYPVVSITESQACLDRIFVMYGKLDSQHVSEPCVSKQRMLQAAGVKHSAFVEVNRESLRAIFGIDKSVDMVGAGKTRISFRALDKSASLVAKAALLAQWEELYSNVEVSASDGIQGCAVKGKVQEWRLRRQRIQIDKRVCVWVDGYSGRDNVCSEYHCFSVNAEGFYPVALVDADTNTVITASQIHYVKRSITAVSGHLLRLDDNKEFVTLKPVASGEVLTEENVKPRPDVVQGYSLLVVSNSGPVSIQFISTALQDGAVGEHIRVKDATGEGYLQALVVDKDKAIIDG